MPCVASVADLPQGIDLALILLPAKGVADVTYASAGNGGPAHLAGALLAHNTGTQMTHIPFKGAATAIAEVCRAACRTPSTPCPA